MNLSTWDHYGGSCSQSHKLTHAGKARGFHSRGAAYAGNLCGIAATVLGGVLRFMTGRTFCSLNS